MISVNVHEAKTHLSRLLVRVASGEEVIIAKAGRPVARLISERHIEGVRPSGMDKGLFTVPDDFDEESDLINEMFES